MRNAFIEELVSLATEHKNIALVVGDLGYSVVEPFADRFPDRFINAGVAEQNMAGLAAGMASEGYHVFMYSIANFPTFRCAEQIRNDVDYHNLPVTVVSVGGGVAYGSLGYSHHAVQDYALMRCMPNMLIAAPGDPMEVRSCVRYLVANPQPSYLRLGKAGEKCAHSQPPVLEPGRWVLVKQGEDRKKTFLTTGAALQALLGAGGTAPSGSQRSVYTLPLWGMNWKQIQGEQIRNFCEVISVEDHIVDGGFGSFLLESLSLGQYRDHQLTLRALDVKVCGAVGSQDSLWKLSNLGVGI
jgi:transketolase